MKHRSEQRDRNPRMFDANDGSDSSDSSGSSGSSGGKDAAQSSARGMFLLCCLSLAPGPIATLVPSRVCMPTSQPWNHGKGLPLAALHARVHLPSIQEQPAFCVLYNPL